MPAMEVIVFWFGVVATVLFFRLTTPAIRARLVLDFWAAVFLFGAAGVLYTALF
jgi:hypothetical protein